MFWAGETGNEEFGMSRYAVDELYRRATGSGKGDIEKPCEKES
jgi:hypothetical protein